MKKRRQKQSRLPKGWTDREIKSLAAHYDNQSEDEAVAEDEAAYQSTRLTMMAVPVELVPKVQQLIAKRAG